MTKFGEVVRQYRLKGQLTQAQVAKKMGYKTVQYVSNVERGVSSVQKKRFKKLSKVLGAPVQALVEARVADFKLSLLKEVGLVGKQSK